MVLAEGCVYPLHPAPLSLAELEGLPRLPGLTLSGTEPPVLSGLALQEALLGLGLGRVRHLRGRASGFTLGVGVLL